MSVDAPRVSVVMPAYQAERWLEQAITSVLVQTHRELELIVVDDASTDRTPDIVRAFADSRVVHHRLERNVGVGRRAERRPRARDGRARGAPRRRRLRAVASPCAPGRGHARRARHRRPRRQRHRGDRRGPDPALVVRAVPGRALHWAVNVWCPLLHPSVMLRRATLPASGYPGVDTQMEDWAMWLVMSRTQRLENLLEPLIVYRRHPAAVSITPKARPPGSPIFKDHLRAAFGLDVDPTTAAAWMRPVNAPRVLRPAELATVARALALDALPFGAHVPPGPRPAWRARAGRTCAGSSTWPGTAAVASTSRRPWPRSSRAAARALG
ncbi:MAG: glycosyltransferase family 2 protein [Myxococcota bacterium]